MFDFDNVPERRHTSCAKWMDAKLDQDPDLIPLWVADMDFPVLPEVTEALQKRVNHGIYGYPVIEQPYYDAVIGWMKRRHQFDIEKDWIVPASGVVSALRNAVQAFTEPQDAIAILTPVYHPFPHIVQDNGRKLVTVSLPYENGQYGLDLAALEEAFKNQDVKALILCSPHNPVGKVWTKEELEAIANLAYKYNVLVLSDEIHMDFVYEGRHIPFFEAHPKAKEFSVIFTAPSKTFNLAGLASSNVIIADKDLRQRFETVLETNGAAEKNVFGLDACQAAYTYGDAWCDEMLAYVKGNFEYVDSFLKENLPEVKLVHPQGLYLAWVDFTAWNMTDEELKDFMFNQAHLWTNPGCMFGNEGSGFERLNLACSRKLLEKAMAQLKAAAAKRQ